MARGLKHLCDIGNGLLVSNLLLPSSGKPSPTLSRPVDDHSLEDHPLPLDPQMSLALNADW